MRKLTDLFNKNLLPGQRVQPTDTFDSGYKRVIPKLALLQDVSIGFEALNRPDMNNILTGTFWEVWDRV